jgi:type IV pilus assembly protein PilC
VPTTFQYRVRDKAGRLLEGSLEADNTTLVANKLREMGYVPIAIDAQESSALGRELHIPGFGGRIKQRDVAVFSRQFATMVNAGLSLLRALQILGDQTENPILAAAINAVRSDVESGQSLSQALAHHPKVFSRLFVSMVRAGETGGVLDVVLVQLADTVEKQAALRSKIRSAMTYPAAVFCLVMCITTGMLLFVVPMFKSLYKQLGGKLPFITQMLINISSGFAKGFPIVVGAVILAVWGLRRWRRTPAGALTWDRAKLRVPIFGRLFHKTALTRFARTLSVLLHSGVPILESLEITADTVGNGVVAVAVKDVQTAVKQGDNMARPLANHKVFPPMVVQMMAVGEETGALDTMLSKIGDFYDQEVEALVDSLTSLLEPILVVFLGATVGTMVVALYLPMFNIIKLVK